MSSRQTWERRAIAGVLDRIGDDSIELVSGLSREEDGTLVFAHERLTDTEARRAEECIEQVKTRLVARYDKLGGKDVEELDGESEDLVGDEDHELP